MKQNECIIITDYLPPFPNYNTKPACVVFHKETDSFLRFFELSGDYFWDLYGTDFKTIELAIEALSKASKPTKKPYFEIKL